MVEITIVIVENPDGSMTISMADKADKTTTENESFATSGILEAVEKYLSRNRFNTIKEVSDNGN